MIPNIIIQFYSVVNLVNDIKISLKLKGVNSFVSCYFINHNFTFDIDVLSAC